MHVPIRGIVSEIVAQCSLLVSDKLSGIRRRRVLFGQLQPHPHSTTTVVTTYSSSASIRSLQSPPIVTSSTRCIALEPSRYHCGEAPISEVTSNLANAAALDVRHSHLGTLYSLQATHTNHLHPDIVQNFISWDPIAPLWRKTTAAKLNGAVLGPRGCVEIPKLGGRFKRRLDRLCSAHSLTAAGRFPSSLLGPPSFLVVRDIEKLVPIPSASFTRCFQPYTFRCSPHHAHLNAVSCSSLSGPFSLRAIWIVLLCEWNTSTQSGFMV